MAGARFGLRSIAFREQNPARALDELSDLVRVFMPDTMITALYGIVDPSAGTWSWAVAGHPPPIVRTPDGAAKLREARSDPPLGIHQGYRLYIDTIEPGTTLVLCTDGLWERRDEPPDVGLARVVDAVASGPHDPAELCDLVMAELLPDGGGRDDAAVLSVHLEP
jgi:serine phosphatase RsbU (regulator of sigma subunit)